MVVADLIDPIPRINCPSGPRRTRPATLPADKTDDLPRGRQALPRRPITIRIGRTGIDASQRLGRHRWVIERTLAWLARDRRLTIRSERRVDLHQAVLTVGGALICFNHLPPQQGL